MTTGAYLSEPGGDRDPSRAERRSVRAAAIGAGDSSAIGAAGRSSGAGAGAVSSGAAVEAPGAKVSKRGLRGFGARGS